jgi:hypothetical protein
MEKIKEKREFSIDYKIFAKDDILLLIKLFGKLSNEILDKSKEIRYKYLIQEGWKESSVKDKDADTSYSKLVFTSYDNSIFTATLDDILKGDYILDNKKIVEINFHFFEQVLDSQFLIRIKHTESDSYSSSSYVLVEGEDKIWVNETARLAEEFFSDCKSQSRFVSKFQIQIMVITIFLLVFSLYNLAELFIRTNLSFPRMIGNLFSKHLISFIIFSSLITAAPAFYIKERLKKLFPRIEIQTIRDFHQINKEKREKTLKIASIILIPAIISLLLRLLFH